MDDGTNAGGPPGHEAASVWRDLVEGRTTVIDHFDSDGRRFFVLRANRGSASALTPRERRVTAAVRRGHANKRIAIELGVAESTVSSILRVAAAKLGVASRLDLVRMLAPLHSDRREDP